MEENIYEDDSFEQFLRESTSDFKMFPSKRVWFSIYNEVHPGSRWPSVAAAIIILTAILYVGISNNNNINKGSLATINKNATLTMHTEKLEKKHTVAVQKKTDQNIAEREDIVLLPSNRDEFNFYNEPKDNNPTLTDKLIAVFENLTTISKETPAAPGLAETSKNITVAENSPAVTLPENLHKNLELLRKVNNEIKNSEASEEPTLSNITAITPSPKVDAAKIKGNHIFAIPGNKIPTQQSGNQNIDNEWIENFAFSNKPGQSKLKKFKGNSTITYYVTPSVGFRNLMKPKKELVTNSQLPAQSIVAPYNSKEFLNQYSALNIELGTNIKYKVTRTFSVKGGVQLNFTNYNINAIQLNHPVQTALIMEGNNGGTDFVYRSSNYANAEDQSPNVVLQSKTMQLSVPLGVDIKIAGHKKLKWSAAATIQPTYVFDGKVYAISYDSKNYVEDNSFLRKINLNTGFETYLTYQLKNGAQFIAGPQVRYQLLSTYDKQYKVEEKLYNIGLKLGISKSL